MKPIQMVDLRSQYLKIKPEVDQAIIDVLDSTAFINGKPVHEFCSNLAGYLGVKHVIPCANGTDALQIALMGLGLKPGDEVITVPFTFVATAEVIALLGLKPVFIDVLEDTFTMDPNQLEDAITPKTKAIIPVHLYGQCCDMAPIMEIADKHNIPVVEDNAQGVGGSYKYPDGTEKKSGSIGALGCISFFPSKNLGAYGDAGAISTNDDKLAESVKIICNHGSKVKYYNDWIGVNSRLDTIQAAILKIKLKHLDGYIQNRKKAADFYDNAFKDIPGIKTPVRADYTDHAFHQYTLQLDYDRDGLKQELQEKNIPAMIYYPVPLHMQKAYLDAGYKDGDFPVTEELARKVLSLPMHSELDEEQLLYITNSISELIKVK